MGWNKRIRHIVEAISPATYAVALRAARAMEGVEESLEPPPPIVKRKRRHDQVDRHDPLPSKPQRRPDRQYRDTRRGQQRNGSRPDNRPQCNECGKNHWGRCLAHTRACFQCGKEGHIAKDCQGGCANDSGNQQRRLSIADRPTQNYPPTRAYASIGKDIGNSDAVVTGTLSVLGYLALTLFDSRSTHSFISVVFVSQAKFVLKCKNLYQTFVALILC